MKSQYYYLLLLILIANIPLVGCSYLDSMLSSSDGKAGQSDRKVDLAGFEEAKSAQQSGDMDRAEQLFLDYVKKNERSANPSSLAYAYSQLGMITFHKNQYEESNQYFEESLNFEPENLNVMGAYGESLLEQVRKNQGPETLYLKAESLFTQALQIAPKDSRFQISLGRTLAYQKKYQLGLRYMKQALGDQGAYEEIAQIYHEHKEYDKAALAMSKAHEYHVKRQQLAGQRPSRNMEGMQQNMSANTGYAMSQPRSYTNFPATVASTATGGGMMADTQNQVPYSAVPYSQDQMASMQQMPPVQHSPYTQQMPPLQQVIRQQQMQQQQMQQQQIVQQPIVQQPMPGYQAAAQPSYAGTGMPNDGFASTAPVGGSMSPQMMPQQNSRPQTQNTLMYQLPGQQTFVQPSGQSTTVPGTANAVSRQNQTNVPPLQQEYRPPYGYADQSVPVTADGVMQSAPFVANNPEIAYHQNYQQGTPSVVNPLADQQASRGVATTSPNAYSNGSVSIGTISVNANAVQPEKPKPTFSGFQAF